MNLWTFLALIIIASIVFDYFKQREKSKQKLSSTNKEVDRLEDELAAMKKRIQNLEAIAANDPDEFAQNARDFDGTRSEESSESEFSMSNDLDRNQSRVSELARKRRRS